MTAILVSLVIARISPAASGEAPVVAAASDLQFALEEIALAFAGKTGLRVNLSFGSSGNFARQIQQGGPYELYLSADEGYVMDLSGKGLTLDEGRLYAIGRIVLFAPKGSPLVPDAAMQNLKTALEAGEIKRFAIANPDHAPYGRAAKEALQSRGVWESIEPRLVLGENIAQAAQFATSGSAQGGILAYSLALTPAVKPLGNFVLLPEEWHKPLRQRMALLKNAGETAKRFYEYLQQPVARSLFERYGFTLPEDSP